MIREDSVVAAVAEAGPFNMGVERGHHRAALRSHCVMGYPSQVHLREIPLLNLCIKSFHIHYYFRYLFKIKKAKEAFVCLFVLPFTILLPCGKFKTHKRRRLINYKCWAAKLLHRRKYMVKIHNWIHKRAMFWGL